MQLHRVFGLALPDDQAIPTAILKGPEVSRVSSPVARQFRPPVFASASRHTAFAACSVLVPKAAMNEDNFAMPCQHQVRPSREIPAVQAESKSESMHELTDGKLRSHVLAPDPPHVFAPSPRIEVVAHLRPS
jgi:hypothetical protein